MKIESPFLNVDEEATDKLIESIITNIKNEQGAFAVMGNSQMEYIQALATEHGFIVQYQHGSLDEHYEFDTYLSRPQTINLFQAYLTQAHNWQNGLPSSKVNVRDFWGSLGYVIGRVLGRFARVFK